MLYHQAYGTDDRSKPALIILHGLFGSSTNWHSMAAKLSKDYRVYNLDLTNHGRSPWQQTHTYPRLAQDTAAFIADQALEKVSVLGHSMGGKAAMQLALSKPELLDKLIVADIAPVSYPDRQHLDLIAAMLALDLTVISSRKEADKELGKSIPNAALRMFLLQNLIPSDKPEQWKWRLNLPILLESLPAIMKFPTVATPCAVPSLFIFGGQSDYVTTENQAHTRQTFTHCQFHRIANAGHWLHAERPTEFYQACRQFLKA